MSGYDFENWHFPEGALEKIKGLVEDPRCQELSFELDNARLTTIADTFIRVLERDSWDQKTQASRDAWLLKFEKTLNQLISLAEEGPRPMADWGFPVRDHILMEVFFSIAQKFEIDAPLISEQLEYFKKMNIAQSTADELKWSLSDTLKHYLDQTKCDCSDPQVLKKPADEKSARASFIVYMNELSMFTKSDIALISSVLFDDESIDDRLVRRLTRGR